MPWCDSCDAYRSPNSLSEDAACLECGSEVDVQDVKAGDVTKAPWHFWLMVGALVFYLGWRLIQGAAWILESAF